MQFGRNLLSSLIKPALALSVAATAVFGVPAQAQDGRDAFLNVSYDVMRDFIKTSIHYFKMSLLLNMMGKN